MKKFLCIALTLCMCLTLGQAVFASGESTDGLSAAKASDSSYPSFDETVGQTAISVNHAAVQTVNDGTAWTTFVGTLELAEGGSVGDKAISGVRIIGADYSAATEDSATDNGIALASAEDKILPIGTAEDFFDVEIGGETRGFNSVIVLQNEVGVDDTVEGDDGVGILMDEGNYLLENLYIETSGMRAPAIYNMNAASTIVTDNCFFLTKGGPSWHPLFTLLTASSRAALLFGGETYFYNDSIVTQDWGCLSQESRNAGTRTYAVNSYFEAYGGGYGAYVLNGNYMDFYGSEIQATDYAIFLCGGVEVNVRDLDAALSGETIADNMQEYGVTLGQSVTGDGRSIIAANINAIVVHTNGAVGTAILNVENAVVTTDPENGLATTGVTGEDITLDVSFRWTESDDETDFNQGESWFAMQNMWGSAALIRSMDSELTFDNTEIHPSNGVLVQSVVTYDPLGSTTCLRSAGDEEKSGNNIHFKNGSYVGDILDQDYQRQMSVTLENAYLTGAVQSYTMQMWNDLWSTENMTAMLENAGLDAAALTETRAEAIRAALIKDAEGYDGDTVKLGVNLTVDADSVWNCTATSSLSSLTVESADGLQVAGSYTVYENCGTDSSLNYYDVAAGTVVETLEPGVTYHDVVIVVDDSCNHFFTVELVKAPTCAEAGLAVYTCKYCGESYSIPVAPTGAHSYVAATTPAACETDGVVTYTCSVCGDSYTETIPAVGHDYTYQNDAIPVYGSDGAIVGYSAYGTWKCSICGGTKPATLADAEALVGAVTASAEMASEEASGEADASGEAEAAVQDPNTAKWTTVELIVLVALIVGGAALMLSFGKKKK